MRLKLNSNGRGLAAAGVLVIAALGASPVLAGFSFQTLGRFDFDPGAVPLSGVVVVGSRLYGVTAGGGNPDDNPPEFGDGIVYSLPTTGGSYTAPDRFNLYDGESPDFTPTVVGNTLYGVSQLGGYGPYQTGAIYAFSTAPGGRLTNLATFRGQLGHPTGGVTAYGANLYGVAQGGKHNYGIIYSAPIAGGNINTVYNFSNATSDRSPNGSLLLVGHTLYGTTIGNGTTDGTVYAFDLSTKVFTQLGQFNGANGSQPIHGVIVSGDTLYGTTSRGGANDEGVVFSLPLTGGVITPLASLGPNNRYASNLTLVGNLLYGTTEVGSSHNLGTVFSVPTLPGAGTLKTILSFNGLNGGMPGDGGLTLVGNTLYGTTSADGSPYFGTAADPGYGTVFSLTPTAVLAFAKLLPLGFGANLGRTSVVSVDGLPKVGHLSFSPTTTGYVAVDDPTAGRDTETFALRVQDSAPDRLGADLADAVWELDSGAYDGFRLTASRTDSRIHTNVSGGQFDGGYDLFITIAGGPSGPGASDFGFDFTQLIGTDNTLSVDGLAVFATAGAPEPTSWAMMLVGFLGIGAVARRGRRASLAA